jgi:hypothetical protein
MPTKAIIKPGKILYFQENPVVCWLGYRIGVCVKMRHFVKNDAQYRIKAHPKIDGPCFLMHEWLAAIQMQCKPDGTHAPVISCSAARLQRNEAKLSFLPEIKSHSKRVIIQKITK